MQYALTALALVAAVHAAPSPQANPAGCQSSYPGTFEITVVNTTDSSKRSLEARQSNPLTLTLKNGLLTDAKGRDGYIASNNQFQFDYGGQNNAPVNTDWAVCADHTLVLGDRSVFQQCLSGDFYNLYTTNSAAQCNSVHIYVLGASSGAASSAPAATQIGDGQPQAPITQIGDGQIQAPTGSPVTQIGDGQIQAPTGAPVTQIGDGQIQAPTGAPVTQIGDGQIQAPTGRPVTQISDGQIQAPTKTGAPVTQIGDGQIQAPTGAPVTQIGDGQVQAPTGAPVTQIGDGQIQAPTNGSVATPTPQAYTGSAVAVRGSVFGLAAGVLAVALL